MTIYRIRHEYFIDTLDYAEAGHTQESATKVAKNIWNHETDGPCDDTGDCVKTTAVEICSGSMQEPINVMVTTKTGECRECRTHVPLVSVWPLIIQNHAPGEVN